MVRTRIAGGELSTAQLAALGRMANAYGRGLADVTVRQNIQFHWVRREDLPVLLEELWAAGLTTTEACGDCVRNIVSCPVAGVDRGELYDTRAIVRDVNRFFVGNREFSNLPRKFKIAITGCALRCSYPEINDIGVFAVRDGDGVAFRARVGGGLSTSPRFSRDLGVLVEPDDLEGLAGAGFDFDSILGEMFGMKGARGRRAAPRQGGDLEASLEIESFAHGVGGPETLDVVVRARERDPGGEDRQQDDEDQRDPGSRPQARTPREPQRTNAQESTERT